MSPNPLRSIPSVNELLESPPLRRLVNRISHNVVVSTVRTVLEEMRTEVQNAASEMTLPSVTELAERIARRVLESETPGLQPVINATGVLLHSALGWVPLAEEAVDEMAAVTRQYANVELDLASGQHRRQVQIAEGLLKEVSGAEAAVVVNSPASAMMLTLSALAAGREVVLSRGQLIETNDGCRLPELIAASGAVLRAVGTLNRTRIDDYMHAVDEKTAALLTVHLSNCVVVGGTTSPDLTELVEIGRRYRQPVIYDLGFGGMVDCASFGISGEPIASAAIKAGADLILASGDKLLGGPRCGLIAGRRALIDQIQKHPLARVVEADKMTLAALAGTLRLYRDPQRAQQAIPLLRLLDTSVENLQNRAKRLTPQLAAADAVAEAEPIAGTNYLSGVPIPGHELATWCVALKPAEMDVHHLDVALRLCRPPVVGWPRSMRLAMGSTLP